MSDFRVVTEAQTIAYAAAGQSLSRFGDGELRLAVGGSAASQAPDQKLAKELRAILLRSRALCCLPNMQSPRASDWRRYFEGQYLPLYDRHRVYGSAFVTRPDNAPWIDTDEYWESVRALWRGKNVMLVSGDDKSLTTKMMSDALTVTLIRAPARDAFTTIDETEERIGHPTGPIIMCLGATATVLAERLAQKGLWALDLGHVGMFMRHAGAYRHRREDLVSPGYQLLLTEMHLTTKWGKDGGKHVAAVTEFANRIGAKGILDYGCGRGRLAKGIANIRVWEYDPGIPEKAAMPKPADLIVCTDVLEHVEPINLANVLDHIFRLARIGAYFVVATREANAVLPDGKNAHLIVKNAEFWVKALQKAGFHPKSMQWETDGGKEVRIWTRK